MTVRTMNWVDCYSNGWRNEIVPEAFSHPAKFARGLIRRIYAHALEQGYLQIGDTCLDPFGGVALGAADALANGLNFVGIELEQNFVDMGAGCDCTGISKADWVACFGRWKRFAHKDGRHWCPRCLAEAGQIRERKMPKPDQAQAKRRVRMRELIAATGRKVDFSLYAPMPFPESHKRPAEMSRLFGAEALVASYKRSSGKIPHTEPHYYIGNLDLFARHARGGATAVLVQGDSRNLARVLEGARAEGVISSPPFCESLGSTDIDFIRNRLTTGPSGSTKLRGAKGAQSDGQIYGTDPAQLGNMPTGEPPQQIDGIVGSPPYATQTVHDRCDIDPDKLTGNPPGPHSQALTMANYGDSEGQLGTMPTGEPPQAVIASPPHIDTLGDGKSGIDWGKQADRDTSHSHGWDGEDYGSTDGQLAAMREGDVPADYTHTPGSLTRTQFDAKAVTESITFTTAPKRVEAVECEWEEEGVDAVIASPPFANSQQGRRGDFVLDSTKVNPTPRKLADRSYFPAEMESDGQLAALPEGEPPAGIVQVDACVSSPPWESVEVCQDKTFQLSDGRKASPQGQSGYGHADGQLGQETGDTFWSAARAILLQCRQALAPGGVAIFVTKRFVRNKQIVEFSQQWADLCQSCGFELIEWIKAWLVEERGTQYDLEGEAHTKTVKHYSFFRRSHAQKYPHLAIEWEDVLIFRKGG